MECIAKKGKRIDQIWWILAALVYAKVLADRLYRENPW